MQARALMTVNVTCILPEASLETAWKLMRKLRARHLPVINADHTVVGMLSDRDLLLHGQRNELGEIVFPEVSVSKVMSAEVISVSSGATASEMVSVMLDEKIDALPVVSPDGRLKGLVTSSDLLALLIEREKQFEPPPFVFRLYTGASEGQEELE